MITRVRCIASGSSGNLYILEAGDDRILLEAGIRFQDIMVATRFRLAEYDACLITHEHKDHCRSWREVSERGVPVYMTQGTAKEIGASYPQYQRVTPHIVIRKGNWTIYPFPVRHDAAEPVGYLIQHGRDRLLYATDTFVIRYTFSGLTHIMIECNHIHENLQEVDPVIRRRLYGTHLSLETCVKYLKRLDLSTVRGIWLIHISEKRGDPQRMVDMVKAATGVPVYAAKRR